MKLMLTRLAIVSLGLMGLLGLSACSEASASLVSTGCSFVPIISASTDVVSENIELAVAAGCSLAAATIAAEQLRLNAERDALEDVPVSSGT